jgi:hypothetical protein
MKIWFDLKKKDDLGHLKIKPITSAEIPIGLPIV